MTEEKDRVIGKKYVDEKGIVRYTAEFESNGGAEGCVYKNIDAFNHPENYPEDELVYIPEYGFPKDIGMSDIPAEQVNGYTRQALIDLAGSKMAASELFDDLTWQFPESLWQEFCDSSDEFGHWIEAQMAYEKVYLPDFEKDTDREGQAPVCYDEFFSNEWKDEEYRKDALNRLLELNVIDKGTVDEAMKDFEPDYKQIVSDNVEKEYKCFYDEQMQLSKDEIYNNCSKIRFYVVIKDYLQSDNLPVCHYKALSNEGENVLSLLYDDYLDTEKVSIEDWDDISEFVTGFTESYYEEIVKEESELE